MPNTELTKQERRATDPNYINDNKYQRSEKIKYLKTSIKIVQLEIQELIASLDPQAEAVLPEEEQKKKKEEFRDKLQIKQATIKGFREELELLKKNKFMSSGFEIIESHKGMNRQSARNFRRQRRYARNK